MTRLEALKELAAKVEAGKLHSNNDLAELFDIAGHRIIRVANAIRDCQVDVVDGAAPKPVVIEQVGVAHADNPARSWLLAILRALIAQEEAHEAD